MAPPSGVAVRSRMSRRLPLLLTLLVAATRLTAGETRTLIRLLKKVYL